MRNTKTVRLIYALLGTLLLSVLLFAFAEKVVPEKEGEGSSLQEGTSPSLEGTDRKTNTGSLENEDGPASDSEKEGEEKEKEEEKENDENSFPSREEEETNVEHEESITQDHLTTQDQSGESSRFDPEGSSAPEHEPEQSSDPEHETEEPSYPEDESGGSSFSEHASEESSHPQHETEETSGLEEGSEAPSHEHVWVEIPVYTYVPPVTETRLVEKEIEVVDEEAWEETVWRIWVEFSDGMVMEKAEDEDMTAFEDAVTLYAALHGVNYSDHEESITIYHERVTHTETIVTEEEVVIEEGHYEQTGSFRYCSICGLQEE